MKFLEIFQTWACFIFCP